MGGHLSDLHSLPSDFTQSATFVHFSTRPPYFVFQYQLLERQLTWLLERLKLEVWLGLEGLDTGGGISYHSHQKCLVGSHSLGLGKINQTAPPLSNDWVRQITADHGGPLSPFPTRLSLLLPSLSLPLSGWFYWRGNRKQKASVWEATCYLRVLGIEASAEASLSALMKAGQFGRFRSQHSSTPHPHHIAGTPSALIWLPSPASFILLLHPHLDLLFPFAAELPTNPANCFCLANLLEMLTCCSNATKNCS